MRNPHLGGKSFLSIPAFTGYIVDNKLVESDFEWRKGQIEALKKQ